MRDEGPENVVGPPVVATPRGPEERKWPLQTTPVTGYPVLRFVRYGRTGRGCDGFLYT